MTEYRLSPIRAKGWGRLSLPAAVAMIAATPMLWAVGLFDATAEPLRHAVIFGISGVVFCALVPPLFGWALQGFAVRKKPAEGDEHAGDHVEAPHSAPSHLIRAKVS
jgi:hypothetical protein